MVLTVHHLGISQSERIVFLCEELGINYKLVQHTRAPLLAPQSLSSIPGNETGKAPFIEDPESGITLSESAAICEYILAKHAAGELGRSSTGAKLNKSYGDKDYADYIYWFHYANAGLQPALASLAFMDLSSLPPDDKMKGWMTQRLHTALKHVDNRLQNNKWLAGEDFTAADVMTVYNLTTQRFFGPLVSFKDYPNILRYLKDVGERPGYQRAMEKGDPEMRLLLGAEPPKQSILSAGGVNSDIWKKSAAKM